MEIIRHPNHRYSDTNNIHRFKEVGHPSEINKYLIYAQNTQPGLSVVVSNLIYTVTLAKDLKSIQLSVLWNLTMLSGKSQDSVLVEFCLFVCFKDLEIQSWSHERIRNILKEVNILIIPLAAENMPKL